MGTVMRWEETWPVKTSGLESSIRWVSTSIIKQTIEKSVNRFKTIDDIEHVRPSRAITFITE